MYGALSNLLYMFIIAILILASRDWYRLSIERGDVKKKMPIIAIVIVAFIFGLFNKLNTEWIGNSIYGGDRQNYLQDYYGRLTGYQGFDLFLRLAATYIGDFNLTLYFTTFLCCLTILIVLRYSEQATPSTLAFILASNFVFFTFTGLKQALAGIFVNIFFLLALSRRRGFVVDVCCIAMMFLSVQFHITGYVLLPVFFMLRLNYDRGRKSALIFMVLLITLLFMEPILLGLARFLGSNATVLVDKINEYLTEDALQPAEGRLAFLKGVPYYCLTYFAASSRHEMVSKIQNYDRYLIISGLASMFSASTIVSYWFPRFTYLFVFPCAILYGLLVMGIEDKRRRQLMTLTILMPLLFFTLRSNMLVFINYGGY